MQDTPEVTHKKLAIVVVFGLFGIVVFFATKCGGLARYFSFRAFGRTFTVEMWHISWSAPLVCMAVAALAFPRHERFDCPHENWEPMVPAIASLYMPLLGPAEGVRDRLRSVLGLLLFPNVLFKSRPTLTLPTMDMAISGSDLWQRRFFFLPNYCALIAVIVSSMELLRFAVLSFARPRHYKEKYGVHEYDVKGLQAALVNHASNEENVQDNGPSNKLLNRPPANLSRIVYAVVFSIYYMLFFVFMYVLIDVAVYGGLMNIDTGMAWELWSLAIEFELFVHVCTFLVKTVWSWGSVQDHPVVLVLPTFLPLVGNWIHIVKDHLAQGLCFAAANCSTGILAHVGFALGYLSIIATIYPIPFLLSTSESREGLRAAHWPITEASVEPFKVEGVETLEPHFSTVAAWKKWITNSLISYCTKEKWIRALRGEIPHTVLHVLFTFFFGGSVFMTFAIILSVMKIMSIPIVRKMVLPWMVREWHCGKAACRKYLINVGVADTNATDVIYKIAKDYQYYDVIYEFFGEYGYTDTQGDLCELVREDGSTRPVLVANGLRWGEVIGVRVEGLTITYLLRGGPESAADSEAPSRDVVRYVQQICKR